MTRPALGTLLRVLAPLLVGAALGVVLQVVDARARLYAAASPGLVAGLAGLLGTAIAAAVIWARRRATAAAAAAATATSAAVGAVRAAASAAAEEARAAAE